MATQVRLIRLKELVTIIGYGRSRLYELVGAGEFPQPVKLGPKAIAWRSDQVQQWIDSRQPVNSP